MSDLTRRQWLYDSAVALGAASIGRAAPPAAPAAPVSIAKCSSYDADLVAVLNRMFDQIGGISTLVRNKTVTIKMNLTGGARARYGDYPVWVTHWVHPNLVGACCHLFGRAGAKRIRLVESRGTDTLEEHLANSGWDVPLLENSATGVEFENTNLLRPRQRYSRLPVPYGGYIYPAFDLNPVFEDTDVFVSLAKLKQHEEAGITLSFKNCFGNTPCTVYGDNVPEDEPSELPQGGRELVLHSGKRQPPKSAPQEVEPASPRFEGYRLPRIIVDMVAARPIDLAIIDGIESAVGGEGPWVKGSKYAKPEVLLVGRNPVCTDAVAAAVMGFNPRAKRGETPFRRTGPPEHPGAPTWADNPMLLAEAKGIGSADLSRIDVRGVSIRGALFDFEAHRKAA